VEKITASLFVCLKGTELSPEEKEFIKKESPAGVTLFKRNIDSKKQTKELIQEIKSLSLEPLLVAVDCEGGLVNRLSHLGIHYPSPLELSFFDSKRIFNQSWSMGKDLKSFGFDLNFAPVVDLPLVQSSLLEKRLFGSSPASVIEKAGAFMEGLLKAGIYPCLKHFPGHGGVKEDSHDVLPEDPRSLRELETQIQVFETLYKKYPCAIMTAHIVFPQIDKKPATFSQILLTKILKQKRNFKGLVFSDDIDMGALKKHSSFESFSLALSAGCDIILSCQKSPWEILDSMNNGSVKKERLKQSRTQFLKLYQFIQTL